MSTTLTSRPRLPRSPTLLALFTLLWASPAVASDEGAPNDAGGGPASIEAGLNPGHEGYGLYQSLCAECHGVRADGNGPNAERFTPPPIDLTRMRDADGAKPSLEALSRVIDGRRAVRAHQADGMPVWGDRLVKSEPDLVRREQARIRLVQSLASYVQSLQLDE